MSELLTSNGFVLVPGPSLGLYIGSLIIASRLVYRTCLSVDTRHNGTGSRPGRNLRPIEMGDRSIFRLKNKERTFVFESLNFSL